MPHDHHDHAPPAPGESLDRAFRWGLALNLGYTLVEAGAGFWTGSLALLADAAHNLTDVMGLVIAWGATAAARRAPSARFTFGLGRATILAALANALTILAGVGAVLWEAIGRLSDPHEVPGVTVLLVALVGIGINLGTAMMFRGHGHDLNARGAFLHMMADAAVSLGVVASAVIILATGWSLADPLAAILVSLVVAWTAYGLLRDALGLALDAVPASVDPGAVESFLRETPGVAAVHDLHVWALSTTRVGLTAHLVMPGGHPGDTLLHDLAESLEHRFGIAHPTLQIELGDGPACRLATRG